MNRYRQTYRLVSLVLLVCFLTTLGGVSANAGHDCCGNCADTGLQTSMHTESMVVSSDCCATRPACTCTFESSGGRNLPAYSIACVNTTGDNPSIGLVATVSRTVPTQDNRQSTIPARLSGNRPRSGPIYLTNQSFLC
jgi:hypothetical protein